MDVTQTLPISPDEIQEYRRAHWQSLPKRLSAEAKQEIKLLRLDDRPLVDPR